MLEAASFRTKLVITTIFGVLFGHLTVAVVGHLFGPAVYLPCPLHPTSQSSRPRLQRKKPGEIYDSPDGSVAYPTTTIKAGSQS